MDAKAIENKVIEFSALINICFTLRLRVVNIVRITVAIAINLPESCHQLVSVFDHHQANSLCAVRSIKEAMVPEVMLAFTEADLSRVAEDDHRAP